MIRVYNKRWSLKFNGQENFVEFQELEVGLKG